MSLLAQRIYVGLDSFPLVAVPLFILAGSLMDTGGISVRITRFAQSLVGHFGAARNGRCHRLDDLLRHLRISYR